MVIIQYIKYFCPAMSCSIIIPLLYEKSLTCDLQLQWESICHGTSVPEDAGLHTD